MNTIRQEADRKNQEIAARCSARLADRYWVVRSGVLMSIPRMELTLRERRHIDALLGDAANVSFAEAARLLALLPPDERRKIIEEIDKF